MKAKKIILSVIILCCMTACEDYEGELTNNLKRWNATVSHIVNSAQASYAERHGLKLHTITDRKNP